MRVISPPEGSPFALYARCVFLAGGISGCPDWQTELIVLLASMDAADDLVLFNPRRENFPMDDPHAAARQIHWEHTHLSLAGGISFWFPKESICPIVLYELGTWSAKTYTESYTPSGLPRVTHKPIVIGMDPEYERRRDVEIQTALVRPAVNIVYSLASLAEQICLLT